MSKTHIDNGNSTAQTTFRPGLSDVQNHVADVTLVTPSGEAMVENHQGRLCRQSDRKGRENVNPAARQLGPSSPYLASPTLFLHQEDEEDA